MLHHALIVCLLAASAEEPLRPPAIEGPAPRCRAGSVVLAFEEESAARLLGPGGEAELFARLDAAGAIPVERCPQLGLVRVEVPPGSEEAACARLRSIPGVRHAGRDHLGEGGQIPADTYFHNQWHHQQSADNDVDTPEAWDITTGSEGIVVAVLDTGIVLDHPEFRGRLLPGKDFVNGDDDPTADHPHGVSVTGILGANAGNRFGVAGVDHRCRILPIKVLDQFNQGTEWNLVQGLVHAADRGARVISMSLINFAESQPLKDALRYARDRGAVLVACSGNSGVGGADISWPGASPLCICVGASTIDDRRASFSGTGVSLDLLAPGRDIQTASIDRSLDGSVAFSGCSAATPIVSGIASLLLSLDPSLTSEEVQRLLEQGAEDQVGGADDVAGWDHLYGWGRANAQRSLQLLGVPFIRGDANTDRLVDIADSLFLLNHLFIASEQLRCADAADANDDGKVGVDDPVSLLNHLFLGGLIPPPHARCGLDPVEDALDCRQGCGA